MTAPFKPHYRLTASGPSLQNAGDCTRLIAARIREERVRLGLNQPSAAALAGVSRKMFCRYEAHAVIPNGVTLFAMRLAGFRVDYILGGPKE